MSELDEIGGRVGQLSGEDERDMIIVYSDSLNNTGSTYWRLTHGTVTF